MLFAIFKTIKMKLKGIAKYIQVIGTPNPTDFIVQPNLAREKPLYMEYMRNPIVTKCTNISAPS
jgi:hypothetical protein